MSFGSKFFFSLFPFPFPFSSFSVLLFSLFSPSMPPLLSQPPKTQKAYIKIPKSSPITATLLSPKITTTKANPFPYTYTLCAHKHIQHLFGAFSFLTNIMWQDPIGRDLPNQPNKRTKACTSTWTQ